ncbi:hypothetical protein V1517DRAFT_357145 [Lipomyces orientalis]|uniref:Uncharacterized protein n=1 Tax=Lipomyces orientalis TaxID=1233043 RepID=A0ACC3TFW4_9ASCO
MKNEVESSVSLVDDKKNKVALNRRDESCEYLNTLIGQSGPYLVYAVQIGSGYWAIIKVIDAVEKIRAERGLTTGYAAAARDITLAVAALFYGLAVTLHSGSSGATGTSGKAKRSFRNETNLSDYNLKSITLVEESPYNRIYRLDTADHLASNIHLNTHVNGSAYAIIYYSEPQSNSSAIGKRADHSGPGLKISYLDTGGVAYEHQASMYNIGYAIGDHATHDYDMSNSFTTYTTSTNGYAGFYLYTRIIAEEYAFNYNYEYVYACN